jgi:hypothetical protein
MKYKAAISVMDMAANKTEDIFLLGVFNIKGDLF